MWVSGCFRLKPQKDKTRRTLRAAAGGRSRRGSRGAGAGAAEPAGAAPDARGPSAAFARSLLPGSGTGPRAQGLPRSRPARGAPARGTRGAGRRRTGEGPQRPLAARPAPSPRVPIPTGSGARGRCPQERARPSPRAQGRPAASKKTTTTHDGFQLFLFSF